MHAEEKVHDVGVAVRRAIADAAPGDVARGGQEDHVDERLQPSVMRRD
jgi:hypothetical protein